MNMAAARDGHSLCKTCLGLDARRPFCEPPANNQMGPGVVTHVCFRHAETLYDILTSALEEDCHLCGLILDSIRKHYVELSSRKDMPDDWDYVCEFGYFLDEDPDHVNDELFQRRKSYSRFFKDKDFEATYTDVDTTQSPVILEFIFRTPQQGELRSRCVDVVVHWTQTGGLVRMKSSALTLVLEIPGDLSQLFQEQDIRNDTCTNSPSTFQLVRFWLNKCHTEHELCRKRTKQREIRLPTRVIDVTDANTEPYLVESKGQSADYVCLSHCWGKGQQYKTDKGSLSKRMSGMAIETMPRTFQDVITITRNLGIQYLWIDSLCIIQDSAEDWAQESAQMGKIYRDASITIFAEHADSDDGGCFSFRSGKASALCRTPMFDKLISMLSRSDCDNTGTFIQAKLHHESGHVLPERHSIFETSKTLGERDLPLNQRAWVLQETILSHKALLYNQYEVLWSCPTMKACECIPEGLLRQSSPKADINDTEELSTAWANIVTEFSKRNLTYSRDKLPALAGIAAEMRQYKHSRYLAGLWQDDLRVNLSWFGPTDYLETPYPYERILIKNSTAPSWSWAKLSGEIRMHRNFEDTKALHPSVTIDNEDLNNNTISKSSFPYCTILTCQTTPVNPLNPLGEVHSGILTLSGPLAHAKLCSPVAWTTQTTRIPVQDPFSTSDLAWFDPDITPLPTDPPIPNIHITLLNIDFGVPICLALLPASADRTQRTRTTYPNVQGHLFERVGIVKLISTIDESKDGSKENEERRTTLMEWLGKSEVVTITVV